MISLIKRLLGFKDEYVGRVVIRHSFSGATYTRSAYRTSSGVLYVEHIGTTYIFDNFDMHGTFDKGSLIFNWLDDPTPKTNLKEQK